MGLSKVHIFPYLEAEVITSSNFFFPETHFGILKRANFSEQIFNGKR
jgi:hypothetical protein